MPKRGDNIRQRTDERWEARFTIYDESGAKKTVSVYGKSYSEAKRAKTEYLQTFAFKLPTSTEPTANSVTVKEAIDLWLLDAKVRQKPTTFARYSNIMETHIIPIFGDCKVSELTSKQVAKQVIEKLGNGRLDGGGKLSPKTVHDIFSAFKTMILHCSKEHGVGSNCLNFSLPRFEPPNINVFTAEEQAKLEIYFKTDTDANKIALYLCLFTGLRLGEICALTWKHIDLEKEIITVDSAIQRIPRTGKGTTKTETVVGTPKTKASRRVIPLAPFVVTFLRENRQTETDLCYVATSKVDKYLDPRTMQNRFERCQERLDIDKKGFHSIRHTFATRCVHCGIDAKTLSIMLGHSSVNITLNRYVHPYEEITRKQIMKLREALEDL